MTPSIRALLRTPFDGPWMAFRHPTAILTAWNVADVRRCLQDADAAARAGAYAVGFVAYEAAPAFGAPAGPPAGTAPSVHGASSRRSRTGRRTHRLPDDEAVT